MKRVRAFQIELNLKVLVFKEKRKPEYQEKNLSEQGREPTTNSIHIWRRRQDSKPGHIGGRRVLSPQRHPLLPSPPKGSTLVIDQVRGSVSVFKVIIKREKKDQKCDDLNIVWRTDGRQRRATKQLKKGSLLNAAQRKDFE